MLSFPFVILFMLMHVLFTMPATSYSAGQSSTMCTLIYIIIILKAFIVTIGWCKHWRDKPLLRCLLLSERKWSSTLEKCYCGRSARRLDHTWAMCHGYKQTHNVIHKNSDFLEVTISVGLAHAGSPW